MNTKMSSLVAGMVVLFLSVCAVFLIGVFLSGCEDDSDEEDAQTDIPTSQVSGGGGQPGSTIWYSGVRDVSMFISSDSWLDVNSDGETDFWFQLTSMSKAYLTPQNNNAAVGTMSAGPLIDGQNPSSGWFSDRQLMARWMMMITDTPGIWCAEGAWCGVNNGYVGLAFAIDGAMHYGWVRISISQEALHGILHDWAYETQPDVGIRTGATQ